MRNRYDSPALRGEENEYGDCDYLADGLPDNSAKWHLSRYVSRCDQCKRYRHLHFDTSYHFYTLDGYDSLDSCECWLCSLKGAARSVVWKVKKTAKKHYKALRLAAQVNPGNRAQMFVRVMKLLKG